MNKYNFAFLLRGCRRFQFNKQINKYILHNTLKARFLRTVKKKWINYTCIFNSHLFLKKKYNPLIFEINFVFSIVYNITIGQEFNLVESIERYR